METPAKPQEEIENLLDVGRDYIDTRIHLFKLKGIKTAADVTSTAASYMAIILFGLLFFGLLNIGLGFYIGERMGKVYNGFFLLSAFYLIVFIILYALRRKIFKIPLSNAFIKKVIK